MTQHAHTVYRPTPSGRLREIDVAFANYSDSDEMRRSLIGHDGYPPGIVVICGRKKAGET